MTAQLDGNLLMRVFSNRGVNCDNFIKSTLHSVCIERPLLVGGLILSEAHDLVDVLLFYKHHAHSALVECCHGNPLGNIHNCSV